MELTPSEFEALISNLFQHMGLDTKLTRASRDGGVDCVAYDSRPVLGGKVIIQANEVQARCRRVSCTRSVWRGS
jgi:restriction system protein